MRTIATHLEVMRGTSRGGGAASSVQWLMPRSSAAANNAPTTAAAASRQVRRSRGAPPRLMPRSACAGRRGAGSLATSAAQAGPPDSPRASRRHGRHGAEARRDAAQGARLNQRPALAAPRNAGCVQRRDVR